MKIPAQSILNRTLYDPWFEHDNCGIGFVARMNGTPSHGIVTMALVALGNQAHRGAVAADANTGDGAGILTQIPRALLLRELERQGVQANAADLALGMIFLPHDVEAVQASCRIITQTLMNRGLDVLAWRDVPTNDRMLGQRAMETKPRIRQVIISRPKGLDDQGYECTLFLARKEMEEALDAQNLTTYIPSLSSRTVVYKGLLVGTHLACFYPDLHDPAYQTAIAVYHQRYSTNTFPTWERAQPFRMVSHNGEINTLQGNINWTRARQNKLQFPDIPGTQRSTTNIVTSVVDGKGSDSAIFDNALEVLVQGGRNILHAMAMMVPEAWEKVPDIDPDLRAFYQYHNCLVEPWDGPAALTFCDGQVVGTSLDRNGLRPARYCITDDGLVISGSEAGVVPLEEHRIIQKGRLGPGQMIAVDVKTGKFYSNGEIKESLGRRRPYRTWIKDHLTLLENLATQGTVENGVGQLAAPLSALQVAFGYTSEELSVLIKPMMHDGREPVGAMGDDTPLAVLSTQELGRPLFQYFKQRFAEVTNPPIDPIRETMVMSLSVRLGGRLNVLEEMPEHAHLLRLPSPMLTDAQLAAIRNNSDPRLHAVTLDAVMPVDNPDLEQAVQRLCQEAEHATKDGVAILIISDKATDERHAPMPSLLAVGSVHHHLIRIGLRGRVSLVVESGDPREVHHMACLIGYGAKGINPYLALASAREMVGTTKNEISIEEAEQNFINAVEKGILKIMSKMGISPLESYCGAQIFEVIGLDKQVIDCCFTNTPSRVGGIGFKKLASDIIKRHEKAFQTNTSKLGSVGFYKFKKDGEYHAYNPSVIRALHDAVFPKDGVLNDGLDENGNVWQEGYERYRVYADLVNKRPPAELRDLMDFTPAGDPIPLEEVEPIENILKRFSTAAMSHGAMSSESHEILAVAMNRLGGTGNSGEGGEAIERFEDERISHIKQVASGRFGVTTNYLVHCKELQIKMAQGSKPGEGGHLPGHKVSEEIARIRHTTPGVPLISPPPHHDIYSIEDLAQLIYDLKRVNQGVRVSVKLVAMAGVGTVAAGVAKGYADIILISGASGGTGASPLSSIKHAGMPWELGLAEAQQTLVLNGLRGRVCLRVDGGLQTGRDVVISAMLGADQYSFGTAAMVAEGCIMARVCNTNNCPVGIATQRLDLRSKFPGKPEMVMAFFRYMAQEIREILASLGLRSLDEAVGRTDLLRQKQTGDPNADSIDLSPILSQPETADEIQHSGKRNPHPVEDIIDDRITYDSRDAVEHGEPVKLIYGISNCDRTVGARLSGAISKKYGEQGLPQDTIHITLRGSAGQSFGAFAANGMSLVLIGEANDYVGKGMSGGTIVVRPGDYAKLFVWSENVIAGNTILYGATGGELFLAGRVGERFAVRNSGATAVVEGVGDHGCEYMTGGTVVILGPTGYNFGAGMTGGVAFVLDKEEKLPIRFNKELIQLNRLTDAEAEHVRGLIQRHAALTESPYANTILAAWDRHRGLFWRVMPREMVAKIEASNEGQEEKTPKPTHPTKDSSPAMAIGEGA